MTILVIKEKFSFNLILILNTCLGGKKVLLKAAGTDASKQFDAFHNPSVLQKLATKYEIGIVDDGESSTAPIEEESDNHQEVEENSNPLIVVETFGDMIPFGDPMWYADFYR